MRSWIAAAAGLAAAAGAGAAQGQTTPTTPAMSAFYASCLASGGAPGLFTEAGSDTRDLVVGLAPRTVVLVISPDAGVAARIQVTRRNGPASGTLNLEPGQSAAFLATDVTVKHNFRRAEYCLRLPEPQ